MYKKKQYIAILHNIIYVYKHMYNKGHFTFKYGRALKNIFVEQFRLIST